MSVSLPVYPVIIEVCTVKKDGSVESVASAIEETEREEMIITVDKTPAIIFLIFTHLILSVKLVM